MIYFDHDRGVFRLQDGTPAEVAELDAKLKRVAPEALEWLPPGPPRAAGLGDLVAKVADALGFRACGGCKQRRDVLNRRFPLPPRGR